MEHCRECEEAKQEVQDIQVRLAVVESKVAKIEENIEKILSNTNWLVKSIVGGMIATLLAFVLKGTLKHDKRNIKNDYVTGKHGWHLPPFWDLFVRRLDY